MTETTVLCPPMETKEERKARNALRDVIRKVVVNAAIHRSREDMLEEVYLAGLWHGVKLSGPQPRKPDYLVLAPLPRRRGRPRKAQP